MQPETNPIEHPVRVSGRPDETISTGEINLLIGGLSDDVAFDLALVHLELRANPPTVNELPSAEIIESAFGSFDRLGSGGLIAIGRIEYIDPRTPQATVAPVRHVAEPLETVRERVRHACATASDWHDWAFSCWLVNTDAGDLVARRALEQRA